MSSPIALIKNSLCNLNGLLKCLINIIDNSDIVNSIVNLNKDVSFFIESIDKSPEEYNFTYVKNNDNIKLILELINYHIECISENLSRCNLRQFKNQFIDISGKYRNLYNKIIKLIQ